MEEQSQSRAGRGAARWDKTWGGSNQGDLVLLGCHHPAAHLGKAASGLGVCLPAAFSNPTPKGICIHLIAHNWFYFNEIPVNASQGNLLLFQQGPFQYIPEESDLVSGY